MCCCNDKTILRIANFISLFLSLALGITAGILSIFLIITPLTAAITEIVMFVIALVVGLIGLTALFFPCSLKCGYTRKAICGYFGRLTFSVAGVIVTGLIVLALNLILSIIASPIFLGIITFFFFYLLANLITFAFVTVNGICERPCSCNEEQRPCDSCNCGCGCTR